MLNMKITTIAPPPALRWTGWAFCFAIHWFAAGAAAQPADFVLQDGVVIHPASVAEGRRILTADDRFTTQLSRFDLESRLGKLGADRDDFNAMVERSVLQWQPDVWAKVQASLEVVRGWLQMQQLTPAFPPRIAFICTNGSEEGGAAYCRGAAVILPQRVVENGKPSRLNQLVAHELFHILSANNRPLQRQLYAAIGFTPCKPIVLPASLRDRKLTNPDGPGLDYVIEVKHEGETIGAVPLLYASVERYDPARGGSFFKYLQFRLLALEREADRGDGDEAETELPVWSPRLRAGQPVLIDAKANDSFYQQIGRNTGYIYHPDEILADNFVYLLSGKENLESPQVVESMRRIIAGKGEPESE